MTAQSKAPERAQLEIVELTFGCFTFPTSIFAIESEARQAWRRYRGMLLSSAEPGTRPRAYYLFELGVTPPPRWWSELALLMSRNLIGEDESSLIDLKGDILSPTQSKSFCEAFETAAGVRAQQLGAGGLRYLEGEFRTAAEWHRFRGRPQLEEKYARLARAVREVIEGKEL
jgi:hypothetical protein